MSISFKALGLLSELTELCAIGVQEPARKIIIEKVRREMLMDAKIEPFPTFLIQMVSKMQNDSLNRLNAH
jgi:hypothetical protein